jgi:hypothetical protein
VTAAAPHPDIAQRGAHMDRLIRAYFDGCNAADAGKITACFAPDAVHYFPPGMYEGPFQGAGRIADKWCTAVRTLGSYWSIDRLLVEPVTWQAVMEWTHFKTRIGAVLRGVEWYEFDPASGLIREIRAYYATPQPAAGDRFELGGFDYAGRAYPMAPPPGARD